MAPKGQRGAGTGQLRTHSRSSSATKLGGNLQFTQKDIQPQGRADKLPKKNGFEPHGKAAPPFVRVNSSQRISSREPVHPPSTSRRAKPGATKPKAGFTIASPGDGDDDEWISSESGAATPAHEDSDSDTASEADIPNHHIVHTQCPTPPTNTDQPDSSAQLQTTLPRVDTARPSDFESTTYTYSATKIPLRHDHPPQPEENIQRQQHRREPDNMDALDTLFQPRSSSQPHSKRSSRPPSTRSISSRPEHPLRPHPLIRGQSYGHVSNTIKPAPLAPLTVRPSPQLASSPPQSLHDYLSTSPTSTHTASSSAEAAHPSHDRRTSISSARSVTTAPTIVREAAKAHDRSRTASTMSASSSSAALSALVHLPSVTRPPSPQMIAFFPPVNPHLNIEGIHPLLPGPYLNNHLTVLMRRTPIRESFDRVIRAKQAL